MRKIHAIDGTRAENPRSRRGLTRPGTFRLPYAAVPYFWSDQFDAKMRFVGVANAAEDIRVEEASPDVLVALFGRDGLLRGALCVNAPRKLARYRQAIADRVPWRGVTRR